MANLNFLKSLALLAVPFAVSAQNADLTPTILHPDPQSGALLYGLSDNGDWGVSNVSPEASGFYDFAGAMFFDLTSNPVKKTDIGKGHVYASAFDVTDDGKTVAGAIDQKPALCRFDDGKWTWQILPVSGKQIKVQNVFTEEWMTYTLDGGEVSNITPDGKWAVGNCRSNAYGNLEMAALWDLTDPENPKLVDLPDYLPVNNSDFSRFTQISADGRYLVGRERSWRYFMWDRQENTYKMVPVELDIYAQGMSTTGNYIGGVVDVNDVPYAAVWDVVNDKLTIYDQEIYADAVAWSVTNEGVPLVSRPYITPYADAFVFDNGFLYSFKEIFEQVYGMNLNRLGIDNTGKPFKVSADGRTMVCITAIGQSYVVRFKEDLVDAAKRVDLFKNWSASPANGTSITAIRNVNLTFAHPIQLNDKATEQVCVVNEAGDIMRTPTSTGGLVINGHNTLSINFRAIDIPEGENWTLRIPEGTVAIEGMPDNLNPLMTLSYKGRGNAPVKALSVSPADGSTIASLSLTDNPIVVRYDSDIKVNVTDSDRPLAKIYIDEDELPVAWANMDVDLNKGRDLVVFPNNTLPLYQGSTYRVVIPAGAVTDMSGSGPNEEFSVSYVGAYVPQLGDEKYLFKSDCNNYDNFLFYEGDHGAPTPEYAAMNFTADETPWVVVMENENSTDMSFGSHSCYTDGRRSNDWVTTRQILIPEDTETYLSFDSQSYRKNKQDYLKVYVYENPSLLNNLTAFHIDQILATGDLVYNELQSPGATEEGLSGEWTHNVIDLTKYAGKPIYICFLNDNQNQSMVIIDNIEVVKNVKAFVTLRNKTNVVNEDEASIWGILTVSDAAADYSGVEMTLRDAEGNVVSTLSESGISLKTGDAYNFEFPQALPLESGIENNFTIEYKLDEDELVYDGVVRNLTFEPVKRVAIEEFTGRDCQFCPGGILTMENLLKLYGDRIVPVAIHCYNGSDPKGMNVMDYWEFTGMNAAPQAMINRGPASSPLLNTPNGYTDSGAAWGEMLWKDYVQQEFEEIPLMEVNIVEEVPTSSRTLPYKALVKSAISMDNVNVRVFAVLLEDQLIDYQVNGYYNSTDPLMGEWGQGGTKGNNLVYMMFDNVARGIWGSSFMGVPGLVPSTMAAGQEYEVEIDMNVPGIVDNVENCKIAVMLIDEATGRVINANMSRTLTGVNDAVADAAEVSVALEGGNLRVTSPDTVTVEAYTPAGLLVGGAAGQGSFTVDLGGYRGMLIVRAGSKSFKMLAK